LEEYDEEEGDEDDPIDINSSPFEEISPVSQNTP
jgi:hypothetical protein